VLIPFVPFPSSGQRFDADRRRSHKTTGRLLLVAFYTFLAGANLLQHLHVTIDMIHFSLATRVPDFSSFSSSITWWLQALSDYMFAHHAQTSVSFDLIFVTLQCTVWMLATGGTFGLLLGVLSPFLSISVTFPLFLAWSHLYETEVSPRARSE